MFLIDEVDSSNSMQSKPCPDVISLSESETSNDQSQRRGRQGGPIFDE
ncbi:21296_t:CDS:1, partial [Gigaspora rosea]